MCGISSKFEVTFSNLVTKRVIVIMCCEILHATTHTYEKATMNQKHR